MSIWVRVVVNAIRGAFAIGCTGEEIIQTLHDKQAINFARLWNIPDDPNLPFEHVREKRGDYD